MELFDSLEAVSRRWNVLEHPFYTRWSRGELTREELGFYSGEYRHAVEALAEATRMTARACEPAVRAELEEHAAQEAAHVGMWDGFMDELDAEHGREPRAETLECRRAWTASEDDLDGLVTLWAIESAQPAIARTKLEGLTQHYGLAAGGSGTEYFSLHAELDHHHAAHSRRLIEERAGEADRERLTAAAERALRGNWELLDGVEREFGR